MSKYHIVGITCFGSNKGFSTSETPNQYVFSLLLENIKSYLLFAIFLIKQFSRALHIRRGIASQLFGLLLKHSQFPVVIVIFLYDAAFVSRPFILVFMR